MMVYRCDWIMGEIIGGVMFMGLVIAFAMWKGKKSNKTDDDRSRWTNGQACWAEKRDDGCMDPPLNTRKLNFMKAPVSSTIPRCLTPSWISWSSTRRYGMTFPRSSRRSSRTQLMFCAGAITSGSQAKIKTLNELFKNTTTNFSDADMK